MTLSGATTPGQSEPGSNGSEGVFYIPESSRAGGSPSDCFMPYMQDTHRGNDKELSTRYAPIQFGWA